MMARISKTLRTGALGGLLLASTALTAPALAQSGPPPRFNQVDANGVDLATGDFFFSMTEGSIGPGEGELTLVRNWAGPAGWSDNWSGMLYRRTRRIPVGSRCNKASHAERPMFPLRLFLGANGRVKTRASKDSFL